ncbi:UvrD-helicase domain-containing protein [Sphingosinicella sp. BN140058]|uniref:UvrD-helicase domain-containing protein n=1 Tax=Sphingosinicella sp. BN140058 TaxID=1892855 RepID=UPI0010112DC3|nr:UvrD-helicase domain-containing protein [Sphingosinicella sp. BN140058]QAY78150.1 ATP-dependent helicase [Sphingosinicella sp. BN140058]
MDVVIAPDNVDLDRGADEVIAQCLDLNAPQSFFLFAGAGSGKTGSLVRALKSVQTRFGRELRFSGRRAAVITYTNKARDEIERRLEFDPIIQVSTIHSFAWQLIGGLDRDIREWLRGNLALEIAHLRMAEAKGRAGKASETRKVKLASKTRRLERLDEVRRFNYSPTGENRGQAALSHGEVLKIATEFLAKPAMRHILVGEHPILLIDESQDTNGLLLDALFAVQAAHRDVFVLGLFGDMMQRIYSDGRKGLGEDLPPDWAKPKKQLNHRCPKRVVALLNKIRGPVDAQVQTPRTTAIEGLVRLYVLPANTADKAGAEAVIAARMAELTNDAAWHEASGSKRLILEHKMAARRLGFYELYAPLYAVDSFKTGLREGTLPILRFFTHDVARLVQAQRADDRFAVARLLRDSSPLLASIEDGEVADMRTTLAAVGRALGELMDLFENSADPPLGDVLRTIAGSRLLSIPESLQPSALRKTASQPADAHDEEADDERTAAIDQFLQARFSQVPGYDDYVSGRAAFDTHQGVKGLEFPRVMVIMDDLEAGGFTFSYEKLLGVNGAANEVTQRLFYVTCSRAEESLALVAYSADPEAVRRNVIASGWLEPREVEVMNPSVDNSR